MKPFLGIDITVNKKNEQMNGEEFIIERPNVSLRQSLESSLIDANATMKKSKLPLPIQIGQWICGTVGFIIAVGILKALTGNDSVSFAEAYQNAAWLFWLGGACLLTWIFLKFLSIRKGKNVLETEESSQVFDKLTKTGESVFSDLNVPKNSKEIDILSFYYKVKNDNIKVCEKGIQITPYFNPIFHIFADSENIYLANFEAKYAIPRSAIKSIRIIKKTIRISDWNKEVAYNDAIYAKYKLAVDNLGCILCKSYNILEFEHQNEKWGIYFPCYELPTVTELLDLTSDTV